VRNVQQDSQLLVRYVLTYRTVLELY